MKDMYKIVNTQFEQVSRLYKNIIYCQVGPNIGRKYNHIISFDTLNTLVTWKYRFSECVFKCATRPDLSGVPF